MGYVFVIGNCIDCGCPFTFNPLRVPSMRVNGVREPICRNCVEKANPVRAANGLELISLLDGAYEPIPEGEL